MRIRFMILIILFFSIVILLWRGLSLNPSVVSSPLLNRPAPSFRLPDLFSSDKTISNLDFDGHVTLLNIWATWCYACQEEHAFLLQLAKKQSITLYGLNYKDDPVLAKKWLSRYGNPYQLVAVDLQGRAAIDFGVYGTPETFLIDKKGMVRYKQVGPITPSSWEQNLKPLVERLQGEA